MKKAYKLAYHSSTLQGIEVCHEPPSAVEFITLRAVAGLHPRDITSVEKGLKNSLFWITLRNQGKLIGMGRVVGDGGTVVQITDICIDPEFQRKGYGKFILSSIQDYILAEIPDDAFVCLFSEKKIIPFYKHIGFALSEEWPGMYWSRLERVKLKEK